MKRQSGLAWTVGMAGAATAMSIAAACGTVAGALPSLGLEAQEVGAQLSIGVGVRVDYASHRDLLTSPRRYDGWGFSQVAGRLAYESRGSVHEVDVWFGGMDVDAGNFTFSRRGGTASTEPSEAEYGDASYRYLRRILESPWWAGLALSVRVNHNTYEFATGNAEGFLYFGALEVRGRRDLELGEGRRVLFALGIPVLSWAARPTYSTVDESRLQASNDFFHRLESGGFTGPNGLQAVNGSVTYEHALGSRLAFRGGTHLDYARRDHSDGGYAGFRVGLETGLHLRWGGGER